MPNITDVPVEWAWNNVSLNPGGGTGHINLNHENQTLHPGVVEMTVGTVPDLTVGDDFHDDYLDDENVPAFIPAIEPKFRKVDPVQPDDELVMQINKTTINKIIKYDPVDDLTLTPNSLKVLGDVLKAYVPAGSGYMVFPKETINKRDADVRVGIEIEIENVAVEHPPGYDSVTPTMTMLKEQRWNITGDASLRNNGYEYVSKAGLQAKDFSETLCLLKTYFNIYAPKNDLNYRCGTHVHIDVQSFTVEQLINLCFLYILFEDTFYHLSGNRYKNHFCVPIRSSGSNIEYLFALLHKDNPTYGNFRAVFSKFKKYMAFNLLPVGRIPKPHLGGEAPKAIGTVEFRHHKGETDHVVLVRWLQAILDIHNMARSVSFSDLRDLVFDLNSVSNYTEFALSVFTNRLPVKPEELITDMYQGSAFLKELYIMSKEI